MKKSTRIAVALSVVAFAVAIAAPVIRIATGTAAAGAVDTITLGGRTGKIEGSISSMAIQTSSANPTGTVCLLLTRPGSFTNMIVYCKALTNEQNHVVWFANALGVFQDDIPSVTNGTGDSLKYSITVTQ